MQTKIMTRKAGTNKMTKRLFAAIMAIAIMMGITSFHTPITAFATESQPFTTPMIAAGNYHTVALKEDGTVWTWGNNQYGQLGDGSTTNRNIPVQVKKGTSGETGDYLTNIIAVAAGGYDEASYIRSFTIALKEDGTVWAWGYNLFGQLGDGTTETNRNTPVQVSGLTDILAISAGAYHAIALKENGTVWTWGKNELGQLGNGNKGTNSNIPVQVEGVDGIGNLEDITAISAGGWHSVALDKNGAVWTWGFNDTGELGNGESGGSGSGQYKDTPVQVWDSGSTDGNEKLTGVTAISAGGSHTVALKENDTFWAWGNNSSGQLGDGSTTNRNTPVQIVAGESGTGYLTGVTEIMTGMLYTVALKQDGTVWAWGHNNRGQLGNGNTSSKNTPVQVLSISNVVATAAGQSHTVALKADGTVWTWGYNYYGQLGNNSNTASSTPVQTVVDATRTEKFYLIDSVQIVSEPTGKTIAIKDNTVFSIDITSSSTCAYQWQVKIGNEWYSVNNNGIYSGETTAILTVSGATAAMNGYQYRCAVTNKVGTVTSNAATLTVNKTSGGAVSAPSSITATKTTNSITISAVSAPANGQPVEYAISTSATAPTSGWQTGLTFYGLTANTTYYVFARSAENDTYSTGTAVYTEIKTDAILTAPSITGGQATMTLTEGYTATATTTFIIGGSGTVTVTKLNGDAKITWNNTNKTLDIATGLSAGIYVVTVKAGNGTYPDALYTFTLTVNAATPSAPVISTASLTGGTVGTVYTTTLAASGSNLIWSIQSGNLPNGLTMLNDGTITGTPLVGGTFNFTVKVTNLSGSDTKALSITIGMGTGATVDAPIYASKTSNSITVGTVSAPANGQAVEYAYGTTNTAPTSTWQTGVTFTGLNANTTYYIFARAKANNDYNAGAASVSPAITTDSASPSAPSISTATLTGGTVGTTYSSTLTANGNDLTWSLESGKLPDGLTLLSNGTIAGTPLTGGTFNFTVKVTNANGTDSRQLSITITDNTVAPIAPSITGGQETMTLTEGYTITATSAFTIGGDGTVTITIINGNSKITWNDTTKKLDIAAGLTAGTYVVTLKASNGTYPDAIYTFTLTVTDGGAIETPDNCLSTGSVVGITIGATVVVFLSGFSVIWFVIKKRKFTDLGKIFKKD